MTQAPVTARGTSAAGSPSSIAPAKLFYPLTGILLLVLTFLGFRAFYLHGLAYPGREIDPSIRPLVIAHGVGMSAWTILFAVQPILIASGRRRLHMSLGLAGGVLAALVACIGLYTAIRSAAVTPDEARIWGLAPKPFMAVPFTAILLFAGFVALGVVYRRKPAVHRPMMLFATLSAVGAAISRIDALNSLYVGTMWERLWGPFFVAVVLGLVLLAIRCLISRRFDRWFAGSFAVLAVATVLAMQVARTEAWNSLASAIAR